MADQPSALPVRKVAAATLGAAGATIVIVICQGVFAWEAPVGLEGAIATLLAFIAGYMTPSADTEALG